MLDKIAKIALGNMTMTDDECAQMNVGVRCETLLNQDTYIGLWCWSDADRVVWSLEANKVRLLGSLEPSAVWFEDGHMNRVISDDQVQVFYNSADAALAVYMTIVLTLIDRSEV